MYKTKEEKYNDYITFLEKEEEYLKSLNSEDYFRLYHHKGTSEDRQLERGHADMKDDHSNSYEQPFEMAYE